uniref:Uncharacterized protein n=1 Tax=Klebsiella pneumoniae TaxID=573 RepID=A0A8B0SRI4_KLEPN|nr:hypothetical protein [Klebsiella pneumoniae]
MELKTFSPARDFLRLLTELASVIKIIHRSKAFGYLTQHVQFLNGKKKISNSIFPPPRQL